MRFAIVLSLILAPLAVLFALQNPDVAQVRLGPWLFTGSTALILMVTFGLGVLVGLLATVPSLMRRKREVRRLEKRVVETTPTQTYTATEVEQEEWRPPSSPSA